jgi:hypothetical protein
MGVPQLCVSRNASGTPINDLSALDRKQSLVGLGDGDEIAAPIV